MELPLGSGNLTALPHFMKEHSPIYGLDTADNICPPGELYEAHYLPLYFVYRGTYIGNVSLIHFVRIYLPL